MSRKHVWDSVLDTLKASPHNPVTLETLQNLPDINVKQIPLYIFNIREAGYKITTNRSGRKAVSYTLTGFEEPVKEADSPAPAMTPVTVTESVEEETGEGQTDVETPADLDVFGGSDESAVKDVLSGVV